MAINDVVRFAGMAAGGGDDDRIAGGQFQAWLQSSRSRAFDEPIGGAGHVLAVGGLSGDAWEANVFAKFVDVALFVLSEVSEDLFHGGDNLGWARSFWNAKIHIFKS
jgi:hypothetical protein